MMMLPEDNAAAAKTKREHNAELGIRSRFPPFTSSISTRCIRLYAYSVIYGNKDSATTLSCMHM
jgi:hypothetical protein